MAQTFKMLSLCAQADVSPPPPDNPNGKGGANLEFRPDLMNFSSLASDQIFLTAIFKTKLSQFIPNCHNLWFISNSANPAGICVQIR